MSVAVKLCGLRSIDDIDAAIDAGANLLGMVLVPGMRRSVDLETARAMANHARSAGVPLAAIVGGMAIDAALAAIAASDVRLVQLVGDEQVAQTIARRVPPGQLIRAIAVDAADIAAANETADAWEALGARVVFDTAVPGALGGTGVAHPFERLTPLFAMPGRGLAGGLHPGNVEAAIEQLAPALVDVSSGIECNGAKDPDRMREFVAAARQEQHA